MPQRVTDQQADMASASTDQRTRNLALDLIDARAAYRRTFKVLAALVAGATGSIDGPALQAAREMVSAGPPIDWDAPAEGADPLKETP